MQGATTHTPFSPFLVPHTTPPPSLPTSLHQPLKTKLPGPESSQSKAKGCRQKGSLTPGKDADIVVWLPDTRADTRRKAYLHKNKETVYEDMYLVGKVARTYVRGQLVFEDGNRKGTKDSLSKQRCGRPVLAYARDQKLQKLKELEERVNAKLEGG